MSGRGTEIDRIDDAGRLDEPAPPLCLIVSLVDATVDNGDRSFEAVIAGVDEACAPEVLDGLRAEPRPTRRVEVQWSMEASPVDPTVELSWLIGLVGCRVTAYGEHRAHRLELLIPRTMEWAAMFVAAEEVVVVLDFDLAVGSLDPAEVPCPLLTLPINRKWWGNTAHALRTGGGERGATL